MAVSNKINMNARFAERLARIHKAKWRYSLDESGIHIYRDKADIHRSRNLKCHNSIAN
jgi:hypothetical protein